MIILEMDSMAVAAYDEIPADEVWVDILPLSSGQDRIIFSGTTTYQGISVQSVMYFTLQEGQWAQASVPELEIFGEDSFYFLTDGVMFVTSVREQIDPSHITAVLTWDQNTGEFIPEQTSDNLDVLSESEIAGFNTGFFNNGTSIMNNMLLNSEYSNPAEIDLFQLFYNGLGGASGQISAEELTLLTEMCSEAANLDVIKITRDEMEAFLRQSLGIELEKTKKTGLDKFYYLDEYDSYYNIVGDTRFEYCTVISGYWESEDKLRLRYVKESAEGEWEVTLQKISDGYLFIANEKLD